jgi:hypothetical protein
MPHLAIKTKPSPTPRPHPSEISVVLTGKAGPLTQNVIASVRRFLPSARVILCSWKPEALAFADLVDECLTPDEPPALWPGPMLNANKQLVAVQSALKLVTTPFCLKVRTDTVLTRADFVSAFVQRPARDTFHSIFSERIVISNLFTINPRRPALVQRNLSFHPSDIAMFGLTEDIRRFWSAPLLGKHPPSPEFALISPEQYFFIHAIRSGGHSIDYTSWMADPEAWRASERYLVANFHVISSRHFGFAWPRPLTPLNFAHVYSPGEWRSMIRHSTAGRNRLPCNLTVFIKELTNFIYLYGGRPLATLRAMWHANRSKCR